MLNIYHIYISHLIWTHFTFLCHCQRSSSMLHCLGVDHIACLTVGYQDAELHCAAGLRGSHIQLAVGEARDREVDTDCLVCLTLSLVDRHCKAWLAGKLESAKLEGQLGVGWNERDSRQKDDFSFVWSTGDGGLNDNGMQVGYDAACAIGGLGWLHVSQDHDGHRVSA